MTLEQWSSLSQVVAAAGVLASLVFVGFFKHYENIFLQFKGGRVEESSGPRTRTFGACEVPIPGSLMSGPHRRFFWSTRARPERPAESAFRRPQGLA